MNDNSVLDNELTKVVGGTSRERKVVVRVDFSNCVTFSSDISIKPYLDGELLSSQIKTVDCSVTSVDITLQGRGISKLKVKINNNIIKNYEVNFDSGTYIEL